MPIILMEHALVLVLSVLVFHSIAIRHVNLSYYLFLGLLLIFSRVNISGLRTKISLLYGVHSKNSVVEVLLVDDGGHGLESTTS